MLWLVAWVLGLGGVLGLLIAAIMSAPPGPRLLLGGGGLVLCGLVSWFVMTALSATAGAVRIRAAQRLHFVPSRGMIATYPTVYATGLLYSTILILASITMLPGSQPTGVFSKWPYVLLVLSLVGFARELWQLRIPLGLRLDESGLRGVRQVRARVDLRWDELRSAATVPYKKGCQLLLTTTSGVALEVQTGWIGSDPNLVAPIISHYLRHPEDRHLLADASAAIRRVEEATAAVG